MIKYRHFKRGFFFGLPVGIAVAFSSARYTGSVVRGVATGLVIALIGALIQGWFEASAERKRQSKGIMLTDVPLRAKVTLELVADRDKVMLLCRKALNECQIRIKKTLLEDEGRLVVLTKHSLTVTGQRITVELRNLAQEHCQMEISSVPRYESVVADMGANYTNVYLLTKFVKDRIDADAVVKETLIDLDKNPEMLRE